MIAFAALGAAGVAFGMAAALAASVLAGLAVARLGESRPLIGTTTTATGLVAAGLLSAAQSSGLGQAVLLAVQLRAANATIDRLEA